MRLAAPEGLQCDSSFLLSWALVLVVLMSAASIFPARSFAQGETTGAILGQVADRTGNGIPGAVVTVTNQETGLKRSAKTDDAGRFNFPHLKPGIYSVRVEAQGFHPKQKNDNRVSGLNQKTTVNFTVRDGGFW